MPRPHVLIADDDAMLRLIIDHKLTAAGYRVDCVENGAEAVEAVGRLHPDILLLDGLMPVMDGFETLRRLKSGPLCGDVQVVMVTVLDRDEDRASAADLGAADYLVKPVDLDDLVFRLDRLCSNQRVAA